MAGWLVRHGARNLTLVSRRATRHDAASAAIAGLERLGAKVTVAAADVASAADVDALLARIAAGSAPLRGVVHAAGVDKPVPLAQLTAADVQQVLSAKVTGGLLLHERTRGLPLDLFLCFSSISSLLGSAGRAHYGAAQRVPRRAGDRAAAAGAAGAERQLGPWSGGGMASPAQQEQFDRIGNYALSPDDALGALDRIAGTLDAASRRRQDRLGALPDRVRGPSAAATRVRDEAARLWPSKELPRPPRKRPSGSRASPRRRLKTA
jgi:hypothetical protein